MRKPADILASVHDQRRPDRTVGGVWVKGLDASARKRWQEYLDAYHAMPSVNTPDLIAAIRSDEILGSSFPKISSESLKKWILREYAEKEKRGG